MSAPRRRAARLQPAERRAQLLRSALTVYARLGLGAARPVDVAHAAHVSLPAVFHYFPTREDLVTAVLDEVEGFYVEMVVKAAAPRGARARALLLDLGRVYARSVDTSPDHARIWLDWSTAVNEHMWLRSLQVSRRVERVIAAVIRRGQRDGDVASDVVPSDAAKLFVASAYAVVQMKIAREKPATVERFLTSAVRAVVGRSD